jgi:four helix bundle protein
VGFDGKITGLPWLWRLFDPVFTPNQSGAKFRSPIFPFLALALALAPALIRRAMNTTQLYFDHEKLVAYQRSIQFIAWTSQALQNMPRKLAVHDQLDRASTSVPLNIAEGNAKYTAPDRCRYFDSARGSALECAACLDVLVAKGECTPDQVQDGKAVLHEVVSLLVGLIRSISPDRLGEESAPYASER